MNRTSAFSKGNSEAQVHRPLSTWVLKSVDQPCQGAAVCEVSSQRTCFSMPSLFCIQLPCFSLVQGISSWILASIKGSYPTGKWYPSFTGCGTREAWFHFLVQKYGTVQFSSYLVRHSKLLVCLNNITIYPAWACRPKPMHL